MISRRTALKIVGAITGYLYGRPDLNANSVAQMAQQQGRPSAPSIRLVLDGMEGIYLQYHGRVVRVDPEELISALSQKEPH